MISKRLLGIIAMAAVAGNASASTGVAISGTQRDAVVTVNGQGTFDALLKVTPTATNNLLMTFSSLNGAYSNVKYTFYSNSALTSTIGSSTGYTIKTAPSGSSSNFTVGTNLIAFSDAAKAAFDLLGAQTYYVKLAGTLNDTDGYGQLLISSNGSVASVTAVPEPESYALILAGLGMIGAIAQRRRRR